ncbi:MAG: hypothetical protein QOF78_1804 [Phycisphaerales bacterium]|nr:hypothetical protein [Phycisphaerales bacterium]
METTLDLGIVGFDAPPGWNFFPIGQRVIARPENRVGVLTISVEQRNAITGPPSHEMCMVAAKAAAGISSEGPGTDRARDHLDNCLAGGESFRVGADFMRVWYHHCPSGLIVAWFSAPAAREDEPLVKQLIKDCERIILSLHLPPPIA